MIPFLNPMMGQNSGPRVDRFFATDLMTSNQGDLVPISIPADLTIFKTRDASNPPVLMDSTQANSYLLTNSTAGPTASSNGPNGVRKTALTHTTGSNVIWSFKKTLRFLDVVTYTGTGQSARNVPHSLGVKPSLVIVKCISTTGGWQVGFFSDTTPYNLRLDTNGANTGLQISSASDTNFVVSTTPGTDTNANGRTYIAYLFGDDTRFDGIVRGGVYTGNGSPTGPIVTLGWEPQWVLIKRINSTGDWYIIDNKRSPATPKRGVLTNSATTELISSNLNLNFNLTGFQLTSGSTSLVNASGATYLYMAIRKGRN